MNSADKWIQTTPKLLNVAEQLCKAVGLAPQQGPSWCSSFSRTAQANCIPAWADPHSTVAIHSHGPVFWHTYVHVSVGWNCWITKDEYIQLQQIMLNSFPKWLYQCTCSLAAYRNSDGPHSKTQSPFPFTQILLKGKNLVTIFFYKFYDSFQDF